MKVSRVKAEENRARVVEVASELFRARGFDGIGVADLMQQAGLTHGGFYANFASKDALAAEAARKGLQATAERLRTALDGAAVPLAAVVNLYLSPEHRDDVANGCVLAALAAEAARKGPELRQVFADGVRGYTDLLTTIVAGSDPAARRERATAIVATMIGALALARTVPDPALSDAILRSARLSILAA